MILAVDIGNTSTVIGLVESVGTRVLAHKRFATKTSRSFQEYAVLLTSLLSEFSGDGINGVNSSVEAVMLCSVVPVATEGIVAPLAAVTGKRVYLVSTSGVEVDGCSVVDPFMPSDVDNRAEVGADRLVNSTAAFEFFGGPVLVVDFGTALTLDYVDETGLYKGGIIAPGIEISLNALHTGTAKLPLVSLNELRDEERKQSNDEPNVIGRNSVEAIKSGVFWGTVSMVNGMVESVQRERGSLKSVVATGGFASIVAGSADSIDVVDEFITLKGLGLIYERKG